MDWEHSWRPASPGLETLSQAPPPRLIKTHLPVELLPPSFWRQGCKVLYVSRDPRDVAVSYYHFYRMAPVHPHPGPWPHFLEEFLNGKVSYGSWFTHVKGWWAKAATHPVLCLRYEDMKEAPSQQLNRVLTFLGRTLPSGGATAILAATSFTTMRANPKVNYTALPRTVMDHAVSPFLRKGEVGDWMNLFTVAQAEAFDARYQELMAGVEGPPIPPSPTPGADPVSH
ncbi:sulfotransferase 1A1-like [Alligator sinensis]|uniref:Sulfotransferase n=1 Tax=Alligator sinensis TaxID=38654 RepID=A0A3Q0FR03_ALLSI|nr:sulfotransferase 1A1-like [Alligator sinensis]